MLLVDHREGQRLECHVLLHQCLGTHHQVDLAALDGRQEIPARGRRDAPRQQRRAVRTAVEHLYDRAVVLLGKDFRRRHHGDLEPVVHGHHGREQRNDGLTGADVALQQPLHGPWFLQVRDDLRQCVALALCQLEGQYLARTLANPVVHGADEALLDLRIFVAAQGQARLEDKEVLEDQPALRRRGERVERVDAGRCIGKMRLPQRVPTGRPLLCRQDVAGDGVESIRRQLLQCLPHKAPLHVRRDTASAFVNGHNAAGVKGVQLASGLTAAVELGAVLDDLELRIRDLQPARSPQLDLAEQHDALVRADDVLQKGLVRPHHLDLAAGILHESLEQAEAGATRVRQAGIEHLTTDGRGHARPQRDDRLQAAAVLVAARKTEQEIFDGVEAGLLQVGGLARTDPLEKLQGQLEEVLGHRRYCTTVKRPVVTSMRRMSAGSSNVSSMDEPPGLPAVRVK